MPKLLIKATELVDTNVNFVSLVKRGANRIPFRIMKEGDSMLDLHKIGRTLFKKAEAKPEIVAAIIAKAEDVETVAKFFKEAGLDPQKFVKSVKDGVTTVAKSDFDKAEDALVMKLSDNVALVVSGLKKAFDGYVHESTSFAEVNATGGYCTSLSMASDLLRATVSNVLFAATNPEEAADGIQKACEEFKKYVVTLTKGLPVQAFKADLAFALRNEPNSPAATGQPSGVERPGLTTAGVNDPHAEVSSTIAKEADPPAMIEDLPVESVAKALLQDVIEEPSVGQTPASPETQDVVLSSVGFDASSQVEAETLPRFGAGDGGEVETQVQRVVKADGLLEALAALRVTFDEGLSAMRADVVSLNGRVDDVSAQVRKTDAALKGTIFAEAGDDRMASVKKGSRPSAPPLLDTAFHRASA